MYGRSENITQRWVRIHRYPAAAILDLGNRRRLGRKTLRDWRSANNDFGMWCALQIDEEGWCGLGLTSSVEKHAQADPSFSRRVGACSRSQDSTDARRNEREFGGSTMSKVLKRYQLLALGGAFGLAMCLVPVGGMSSAAAATPESMQGVEQQQQPTSPSTGSQQQQMQQQQQEQQQMGQMGQQSQNQPSHHQKQSVLTGKIAVQGGNYVFESTSSKTTLTISNPKKAKKYSGQSVQVKGKVNQQAATIHISKIKAVSS